MFGVQIAGNKPATLVPTAEVIARECDGGIDFMDLNCGCPIDLVFRTGSGSARTFFAVFVLEYKNVDRLQFDTSLAVLDAAGKLGKILIGMNRALGEIPLTIKMRTGVKEGRNTAHKLMPRISSEWNVAAMTVSHPAPDQFATQAPIYYGAVARSDETAAIYQVGGLGIHPRMCQRRPRARRR
jgi:tRNA-dihydrouridine synthase 3